MFPPLFFLMWSHHFFHFHRSMGMNNLLSLHSLYCITEMTSKRPKYYAPIDRLECLLYRVHHPPRNPPGRVGETATQESALNNFFKFFHQKMFPVQ